MSFAKRAPMLTRDICNFCFLNIGLLSVLLGLAYGLKNPYAAFLIPVFMGLSILTIISKEKHVSIDIIIPLSPAVGVSILILSMYVGSALRIGLSYIVVLYNLLTLILAFYACMTSRDKYDLKYQHFVDILTVIIPAFFIVLVHWTAYTYPADNVDNLFHATKIEYLLRYNTMYPQVVPIFDILTYPGGYHSIVTYITLVTRVNIPTAMKAFRAMAWILFSFGVYLFSRVWFNKGVARFSILVILLTNICYYYLLVYIEPNFTGFYFFLVMLSMAYLYLNNKLSDTIQYPIVFSVILGAATIFVHPYSFQNFVFVIAMYVFLVKIKPMIIAKSIDKKGVRDIVFLAIIYGILPLWVYIILNPFFIFPQIAHVQVEYPWASYTQLVIGNLTMVHVMNPHDTPNFFKLLVAWSTIRNENYAEVLFIVLSGTYIILRNRAKKIEYLTIIAFFMFVFILIANRLTINIAIPFYGTAAMERMYLWLVPLFPVLVGMGFYYTYKITKISKRLLIKISYIFLLIGFFVIPIHGTARDLISAEANFYVTPDVLEDFMWIKEHTHAHYYIFSSCYSDSTPWLPFFVGLDNYTVMFDTPIKRCRFYNWTFSNMTKYLLSTNSTLPYTIAYIDTNAPNLNPLQFAKRYKLLRIGENNWIFNLSSNNTRDNTKVMLDSLKLCSDALPGDTFSYGRYYVWGFTKKYFYVTYYNTMGLTYAWILENNATIAFNPCRLYNALTIHIYTPNVVVVNFTINNKLSGSYELSPGEHDIEMKTQIVPNVINTIYISKTEGIVLIKDIKLGEEDQHENKT